MKKNAPAPPRSDAFVISYHHLPLVFFPHLPCPAKVSQQSVPTTCSRSLHSALRIDSFPRHQSSTSNSQLKSSSADDISPSSSKEVVTLVTCLFAAGAILGPILDNFHSLSGALQYHHPWIKFGSWFTTDWWVPPLFGIAGVIIGGGTVYLDRIVIKYQNPVPSARHLTLNITSFIAIYALSGLLYHSLQGCSNEFLIENGILSGGAVLLWFASDKTVSVAIMGVLTLLCGPAIEIGLINLLHFYHYSRPDVWGIPIWIFPVYFAGASPVGNLGRWLNMLIKDGKI